MILIFIKFLVYLMMGFNFFTQLPSLHPLVPEEMQSLGSLHAAYSYLRFILSCQLSTRLDPDLEFFLDRCLEDFCLELHLQFQCFHGLSTKCCPTYFLNVLAKSTCYLNARNDLVLDYYLIYHVLDVLLQYTDFRPYSGLLSC